MVGCGGFIRGDAVEDKIRHTAPVDGGGAVMGLCGCFCAAGPGGNLEDDLIQSARDPVNEDSDLKTKKFWSHRIKSQILMRKSHLILRVLQHCPKVTGVRNDL